jgi:hypothetical protein
MRKCNSCGGTYSPVQLDGMAFYHACPPDAVEPAEFDAQGHLVRPEKRTPRTNRRDERPAPGLVFASDAGAPLKCFREVPHPEERGRLVLQEATPAIVSEGDGFSEI